MSGNYMSKFDLSGKNIVLTGALGILGNHFLEGLAESGANVALLDMDQKKCSERANEIEFKFGHKAVGYGVDLSVESSIKDTVEKIIQDFGEIHILHNNAASKSSSLEDFLKPMEEYSLDTWNQVMKVNLDAMFLLVKEVATHMVDKGIKGSIIQTSSIYGVQGPDFSIYEGSEYNGHPITTPAVYSASKAGVIGLTKYFASYYGPKGIRVNTLTPGGVESGQNSEFSKKYSAKVPLNRMANPQDMVGALIFLASDASSYITGQNIIVDGGFSIM